MSHQHVEKLYTDEESKSVIGTKDLPIPMGWKILIQPNQIKQQTKGGILVSVGGKLIASNVSDIMSQPDETGRRWVANSTFNKMFGDVLGSSAIESELSKNKIWKEKYSNLSIEQIKSLNNKEKAEYIKIYIDTLTKMMIKNKDIIKKVFELAISRSDVYWNEIVLSQIKVKDALIFSDSVPMKFVWDKHPEKDTVSHYDLAKTTWGKKFISKKQIMNIVKKTTTGKVIWGKLTDMPGFIKSRGGSPHEPKISIGVVS